MNLYCFNSCDTVQNFLHKIAMMKKLLWLIQFYVFPGEEAAVQPGLVQKVEVDAAVGDGEGDPEGQYLREDPLVVEGGGVGLGCNSIAI